MNLFSQLEQDSTPTQDTPKKGILYCDGGSRGNPGPSAGGSILYDEHRQELDRKGTYYGIQTNNFAEYSGLIDGLGLARKHQITDLQVYLDAKLVVEQMNGQWKVKNANIKPLWERAKTLTAQIQKVRFTHVLREKNKVADKIVNEALDKIK